MGRGSQDASSHAGWTGNDAPTASRVKMMGRAFRPLVESGYSMWMVTRRRGMPQGHTIEDMADDYADLIASEFDGKVDLCVGLSYGGAIGQYLAANHPDSFEHIALVGMAHTADERGLGLDYDYATALSQGHSMRAARLMAGALLTGSKLRWGAPALGTIMGLIYRPGGEHDQFASDVMVEAEAEMALDTRPVLSRIRVPVLLVVGDKDFYIPVPLIEETARLIPDCTLEIYEGKGHVGAIQSRRLAFDILDFANKKPVVST